MANLLYCDKELCGVVKEMPNSWIIIHPLNHRYKIHEFLQKKNLHNEFNWNIKEVDDTEPIFNNNRRTKMKYKVGDKVVIKKCKKITSSNFMWIDSMDNYIGKKCTIREVNNNFYFLENIKYGWNEEWYNSELNYNNADITSGQRCWTYGEVCEAVYSVKGEKQ